MQFKYTDPVTDFNDGLMALKAYHEDFLERGKALLQLVFDLKMQGMNQAYANQCMSTYCHYEHANHLHHQDEERALFPLLVNRSALMDGMIERLLLDHEEIEKAWCLLAVQLKQPEAIKDFVRLQVLALEFEKLQREHLAREDEDFSPQVKAILSPEQRAQVGAKMAALRHLEKSTK
ncbi:MAG: hemerythrin domain-containing protein [Methyloprofundus sp.]|nr:hemerythrin domain-containing protein [Methyloprofundus sp.]MDT8426247.1 hemerythrin domain-containing protein [Methyloprofundus sp.]